MAKKSVPSEAFWFKTDVAIEPKKSDDEKQRSFEGVAYSGKPLNHFIWDKIVFDLETTQSAKKIPALIDHLRASRAGVASLTTEDNQLLAKGKLLSNKHGQEVAQDADEGFPWQMSVHIEPGSIERFNADQTATVNGKTINGPLHVFRNNTIREVSFTPTGVDGDTTARVMSTGNEISIEIEDVEMSEKNENMQSQLDKMQTQIEGLQTSLTKEKERADNAEKILASELEKQRQEAVASLEKTSGKLFSDDEKKLLMEMDEKTFKFMSASITPEKKPEEKEGQGEELKLRGELFSFEGFDEDKAAKADTALSGSKNPLVEDARNRYASAKN